LVNEHSLVEIEADVLLGKVWPPNRHPHERQVGGWRWRAHPLPIRRRFCLAVLRLSRGPSADGGTLATIAGISRYYSVRWQQGQMYMDRAEQLVRLAGALDIDIKILIDLACGTLTVEQAFDSRH